MTSWFFAVSHPIPRFPSWGCDSYPLGEFDEILPPRDDISLGQGPRDISSLGGNIIIEFISLQSLYHISYVMIDTTSIPRATTSPCVIDKRKSSPTRGTRKLEYPAAAGYSKSYTIMWGKFDGTPWLIAWSRGTSRAFWLDNLRLRYNI